MVNVIGVRFENAGKLYFFDPGQLWPTPGDFVLVETSRGIEFGEVVTGIKEIDDSTLQSPIRPVVRIADANDVQHAKDNKAAEKEAYHICQNKINEHKLDMKLVSVEITFDNAKMLFNFTANGRVDFRSLVKDLAGVFKTRIELRQIGVRDEARMLGGLGICGRPICCGTFLGDFQPVSIKMAKEQNLSLNPTKISGVCGRLMCCLKYEQDQYEQTRKKMPKVGKEVMTPDGNGVVWDLNVIKETVRVRIGKADGSSELRDYPMEDVQRPGQMASREIEEAAEKPESPDVPETTQPDENDQPETPRSRRERPARGEERKSRREEREAKREQNRQQKEPCAPENRDATQREETSANPPVKQAETPEAVKPEPAQTAETPKPAVSSWMAALEAAKRAAEGKDGKTP